MQSERGAVQVDPGDHFGHEHRGPAHLHPVPRRVEQVSHHLEPHDIRLVSSGTPDDPDRGVGGRGRGPRVPLRGGGRVVGEHVEDLSGRLSHELSVILAQQTAITVLLGIVERGEEHRVIDRLPSVRVHVGLDDVGRLVLVAREQSLVVARLGLDDRPVTHEHDEEPQGGQVLAEHDEADRQGRRHQQPHRSPEPGPEGQRDQERDLRYPGTLTVQPRLQHHAGDELQHEEQTDDQRRLQPPREHRQTDGKRQEQPRRMPPGTG